MDSSEGVVSRHRASISNLFQIRHDNNAIHPSPSPCPGVAKLVQKRLFQHRDGHPGPDSDFDLVGSPDDSPGRRKFHDGQRQGEC
jgi:hypothetical protein